MIQIFYLKDLVQLHSKLLLRLLLVIWLVFLLVTFNILLFLCYSFCASRVCWTNSTRFLSMPPLWIYFPSGMCTDMCFVKVTVFLSLYNSISLSIFCDADLIDMSIFGVADLMDTDSLGFCLLWDIPFRFLTSQITVMLVGSLFHLGLRIFFSSLLVCRNVVEQSAGGVKMRLWNVFPLRF